MRFLGCRLPIVALVSAFTLAGAIGCSSDKNQSAAVADNSPGPTESMGAKSLASDNNIVMVLADDQVSAALASAPTIDIESFSFVESRNAPTGFAVRVGIFTTHEGPYEFELIDAASDRPLAVTRLEVSSDGIDVAQGRSTGPILIDIDASDGGDYRATIEVSGLDVGSARQVLASVRTVSDPTAARPWEDVLGCADGVSTFQWRNPDDDVVKAGVCPNPFEWISTQPTVPLLAPTPDLVAAAAGFTEAANLEQHLTGLVAALRGDEGPYDALQLKFEISMTFEVAPGVVTSEPLEDVGPLPAPEWDPAMVASSVEQALGFAAQDPTGLNFDIEVISADPKATVLAVTGVHLPLAPTRSD
jgi:hypothetical protein